MNYARIVRAAIETPWAILPGKLEEIRGFLEHKAAGGEIAAKDIEAALGSSRPRQDGTQMVGSVAIISITGTIANRMNMLDQMSGGCSLNMVANQLRAAVDDPQVSAVVLDIDSPGGSVAGVPEFADLVTSLKDRKKIVAVANGMAASAAYWIASACSELVVTPSGQVGSIGVFTLHQDVSKAMEAEGVKMTFVSAGKYKVEGNPYEALSDDARAAMQDRISGYYDMFVRGVAQGRGASQSAVRDGFGQGRMVLAKAAVAGGMADRVDTIDNTVARLLTRAAARAGGGPRASVQTIRDFEAYLRDGGWSHNEAKSIASDGFGKTDPRDEGGEMQPEPEAQELKESLKALANSIRADAI